MIGFAPVCRPESPETTTVAASLLASATTTTLVVPYSLETVPLASTAASSTVMLFRLLSAEGAGTVTTTT